ncbi:MAG: TIGR03752 family integrating conjugative element protein [Betaproteobacteria bacterium]|nr:TIGR03752 family integrating conjugative element protein [Betaproteobacteria bacterium]
MKSNPLLKWLVVPVLLVVFVIFKYVTGSESSTDSGDAAPRLTPDEMKALGVEADTPKDTLATLVGQVKQLRGELKSALSDNDAQKEENRRLREREVNIDQRLSSAFEAERQKLQAENEQIEAERKQAQGLMADLMEQVAALKGYPSDYPLDGGKTPVASDTGDVNAGTFWHEPISPKSSLVPNLNPGQKSLSVEGGGIPTIKIEAPVKPVYTLPVNSTLVGSVAMTALIGRVPVDGTVNDPFPFKVVVGPENLAANGIELPDVAGAVASGMASGDWTLSCVRGQIRSFTFVFNDGTIRTLPEVGNGGGNNQGNNLGWISDASGIPCVSGERKSNAAQYLGTQSLITAAGAGAASLVKSDTGRVVINSSDPVGNVGISTDTAMGRIIAGGVQDMSQWVNKLYGQAFAAIYVPPSAKVAVHLDQPLTIDYDPKGRKVDFNSEGETTDVAQLP